MSVAAIFSSRYYDFLSDDHLPEIVATCRRLLMSEAMFLILSNLTGLRLHRLAPKPISDSASSSSSLVDLQDVTFENPVESPAPGDGEKSVGGVDSEGSATSEPTLRRKRRRIGSSGEAAGCSSADAAAAEMLEEATPDAEGGIVFLPLMLSCECAFMFDVCEWLS